MSEQLKPCPWMLATDHLRGEQHTLMFVGGDHYLNSDPQFVQCSCGAQGPACFTEDDAIAAWNRRQPADAMYAALEAVQALFAPESGYQVCIRGPWSDGMKAAPDAIDATFVQVAAALRAAGEKA